VSPRKIPPSTQNNQVLIFAIRPINGIPDNTQLLVMSKYDGYHDQQLPPALQPHIATMEKFQCDCHDKVVYPLLRLCAKVLELEDEEHLVKQHLYNEEGETQYRFMHYAHRTAEENKLLGNIYAGGHTDLGGITLLFRQPIVALQVYNSRKEWKWVKPMPGHIVVNICDALSAMTGGYFRSTIHRVHTPPADQAHLDRTGVLLLSRYENLFRFFSSTYVSNVGGTWDCD
jgi:isopenicillin N synthase-like dioxygenase